MKPFFPKHRRVHSSIGFAIQLVIVKVRLLWKTLLLLFFLSGTSISSAQCTLICNGEVTVSLGSTGTYQITTDLILSNPLCAPDDFSIQLEDEQGNPISNPINCNYVGKTIKGLLTNLNDGNTCWGNIKVEDHLAPFIQCPDLYIFCYENADPAQIGFPNVADNCTLDSNVELTYVDNFTDLPCYTLQGGFEITAQIERIWNATDQFGNAVSCTQYIYNKRITTADVTFPVNKDGFESPSLDCGDDVENLDVTGQPTINGTPITSGGLCELAVSYTDQTFDLCGSGGYKIIRTWTVVDWCSSDFILDAQVINVMDQTPPTLTCPNDLTFGTTGDCVGEVIFPTAAATDDCSDHTISLTWQFGDGLGPFSDVPFGSYPATYTATDDCSNATSCTIQVTIEDTNAPIAICESSVSIELGTDGTAMISADVLDNGSFDNCEIDHFEIIKNGVNYGSSMMVSCEDLNAPITATLKVFDTAGNSNSCTSNLNINDHIAPVLICPLAKTIHCEDDATDLNITGNATATDNCTLDTLFFKDEINLNTCEVGTINRTWTATDFMGNSTSCIQVLAVEDATPLQVDFPENVELTGCSATAETTTTGVPTFANDECESIGITYDDVVFFNGNDYCKQILRTWTVINWCV
ncbi:MAG: HYR domain-containing protein, partial [Bacteroidota bacterium]